MSVQISFDRNKIGTNFKASVFVSSEEPITAYEVRATAVGASYGRGIGYDLISDDAESVNGVVTIATPTTSFSFDVESSELPYDGQYRVSVYVKNSAGIWNDCVPLFTDTGDSVFDSTGSEVYVLRNGSGNDIGYMSSYSGSSIDNFIEAVI